MKKFFERFNTKSTPKAVGDFEKAKQDLMYAVEGRSKAEATYELSLWNLRQLDAHQRPLVELEAQRDLLRMDIAHAKEAKLIGRENNHTFAQQEAELAKIEARISEMKTQWDEMVAVKKKELGIVD